MDESAIKDQIGIRSSAHRAKIVSSLVLLRAKHNLRKHFLFLNKCLKRNNVQKVTKNCLIPEVAGYKARDSFRICSSVLTPR